MYFALTITINTMNKITSYTSASVRAVLIKVPPLGIFPSKAWCEERPKKSGMVHSSYFATVPAFYYAAVNRLWLSLWNSTPRCFFSHLHLNLCQSIAPCFAVLGFPQIVSPLLVDRIFGLVRQGHMQGHLCENRHVAITLMFRVKNVSIKPCTATSKRTCLDC